MRIRAAGAHLRSDPDRFHDLLAARPLAKRGARMTADAVGTLRHVRDRNGDQLLRFGGKRSFGKHALAECAKGTRWSGSKTASLFSDLPSRFGIERLALRCDRDGRRMLGSRR